MYLQFEGLIRQIAVDSLKAFRFWRSSAGTNTYSLFLLEDLVSEGAAEFFERVQERKYDASVAKLTTYMYPHIKGVMHRYLEKIVARQKWTLSTEDMPTEDYYPDTNTPPHVLVYRKICAELLRELFNELPYKDRTILGQAFGAFGYSKLPLEDIAFRQVMRVNGVDKARKRALEKLRAMYPGSRLEIWRRVWKLVMEV